MSNITDVSPEAETNSASSTPRKPYHSPKMEDYGAVNDLSRSGAPNFYGDFGVGYSSIPD